MTSDRVLCMSAERLTAWVRCGRTLRIEAEFAAGDAGCTGFAAYLAQHPDDDFLILADFADEEFELQEIPAVRGRDRRALVARKLEQIHFGAPLTAAIGCGRRKDGRRDERVLFAALPRAEAMGRWLPIVERANAAVAGIASMAQLVERLPSLSAHPSPHRLVMTATNAGLRQTFLENGRLRLSRLTPAVPEAELPAACAAEAERFRQYLAGRVLAHDAVLPVTIVADVRHPERFRTECANGERLRFEHIDLGDEFLRAGARDVPSGARTEALFVHLLMQRRPTEQFAPPSLLQRHLLRRTERSLRRAAALSLAAGLLTGGLQWVDARQLQEMNETLAALVAADARRHEMRLQALPPLPVPVEQLGAMLDRYESLQRQSPQPTAAYRLLGNALAEFPQVFVERLDWKLDAGDHVEIELKASLPPGLAGDPRGQLAVTEGLKRRLEETPRAAVRILAAPFDADPGKPLTSGAANAAQRSPFSLRIALPAE